MAKAQNKVALEATMHALGNAARKACASLAGASGEQRNTALTAAAAELRRRQADIVAANDEDMRHAVAAGLGDAMRDRLMLDKDRVEAMACGLESIVGLDDPVGKLIAEWRRPNGLHIQRVSVPLGVIGIIYESRPNVTADAAGLCIKSANAAILRGGSESFRSNVAIYECIRDGLRFAGLDTNAVQIVPTTDRAAVGFMLSSMTDTVDVVVPRGGKSLIRRVQQEARVPVIGHLDGICHVYVHEQADAEMACKVVVNAKMRRTGICGAAETVLIDRAASDRVLAPLLTALQDAGCEVRGDDTVVASNDVAVPATEADWSTEYLDAIISVRIVDNMDTAIDHIRRYGSGHTESIITDDQKSADKFLADVDSAIVLHNASTQFADGGEFGMGAEIGIATGRIHARGPVGAEQLTSYKYVVRGTGQSRP